MQDNDRQLGQLLREADSSAAAVASAPLDATQLLRRATVRSRNRLAVRTTMAAVAVVAVAIIVPRNRPAANLASKAGQIDTVELSPQDVTALVTSIEQLEGEVAALVKQFDAPARPTYDILTAMEHAKVNEAPNLRKLRGELAALESRAAAHDAQLAWNIEWSRSGALRLELARLEERADPAGAQDTYRQIAAAYSGTRWGDEAHGALVEVAGP
jgi:hypothetical protein